MSKDSNRSIAFNMFTDRLKDITLPFTKATEKPFRKGIIMGLVEMVGCTIPAASTHYAWVKNDYAAKKPEAIVGLGRAEGKNNGGRKKKVAEAVAVIAGPTEEDSPLALLDFTPPAGAAMVLEQPAEETAPAETPAVVVEPEVLVEPQLVDVVRCKDGEVVAQGVTQEAADALIEKAAAAKKAKLMIKE